MTLAIEGGTPVRSTPFTDWPIYNEQEKTALIRALDQGDWWRVAGSEVDHFEAEFAGYHAAECALAVSSGTAAIELALRTLDIGEGDEVIVPGFTFISTSLAVQNVSAVPVVVDVATDDLCLDVNLVAQAITDKTKAVIPVHMSGHPVKMAELKELLEPRGIAIIQDAAHAHGMEYDGKKIGEWGTMACFSFQNFKLMTAGEGGLITFPDTQLRDKAYLLHNCGRPLHDKEYRHLLKGNNYRMGEFAAAVLREQLKRLPEQNAQRTLYAEKLRRMLADIPGVVPQTCIDNVQVNPSYMVVFCLDKNINDVRQRNYIVDALVAEGIPAFRTYPALYATDTFWVEPAPKTNRAQLQKANPNTERVSALGVWIHHRVLLGREEDLNDIVTAVKKVTGN